MATTAPPTGRPRGRQQPRLEGAEKYVAVVPQVFDLWQDPQERYDIFANNYTERTWTLVTISAAIKADEDLRRSTRRASGYDGPIEISEV